MSDASALACTVAARRARLRARGFNGIDYVEVEVFDADGTPRTRPYLCVHFLGEIPPDLTDANVRLTGGHRVPAADIRVVAVEVHVTDDPEEDDCLRILLDRPGDRSPYTLALVDAEDGQSPLPRFDRRYSHADFSFGVDCASTLDCRAEPACPPPARTEPAIDYLAKDYASFRQLMLDRLALLLPDWRERHVPDLGITLVELLAYVADHLSYYQDAVATEAYLDTARLRISVRRHARLVDYAMHEGCNARAWVCIDVGGDLDLRAEDVAALFFITGSDDRLRLPARVLSPEHLDAVPTDLYEVFEPVPAGDLRIREAHSVIHFYTWEDRQCCLPRGATAATLADRAIGDRRALDALRPGDVLIFEEVLGPETSLPADADPTHRHVVRLTAVTRSVDEVTQSPVVDVAWALEDALPFPLCLTALTPAPECRQVEVSVALGNVVLVDHGRRIREDLGTVECEETVEHCEGEEQPSEVTERPRRFRPTLTGAPLTFAAPVDPTAPAARALARDARTLVENARGALPAVALSGITVRDEVEEWTPRRDVLGSGRTDRHFVAEIDDVGRAHLRFGDGELGREPAAGTRFAATYRIGNGSAGNVGAEAISHLVLRGGSISTTTVRVRNPLPASGGVDLEPIADVKRLAPYAFRSRLDRAVTADDYARIAERELERDLQRAATSLQWTGSWYEAHVTVDPSASEDPAPGLLDRVRARLESYRRLGHDLAVARADYVPLHISLVVYVRPHYLRGDVEAAVRAVLSTGELPDGRKGFFHPDNFTFGTGIALARLVAVVQAVEGVESVVVETFARLHEPLPATTGGPVPGALDSGFLALGPREIAQLDDDPDFPDRGKLVIQMRGGR